MNKAQEMFRRSLHGKETMRASAEEFYNEVLLDIGNRADNGFFDHQFDESDVPDYLRPHIDEEIVPIFEENGFSVKKQKHCSFWGGDLMIYYINWHQTGE